MKASETGKKAWDHLKTRGNLYTILCLISALVGMYADYQSKVADLKSGQSGIEGKAKAIDSERVTTDRTVVKNLIALEGRLVAIETKLERVEKDTSSFWQYILGSKTTPVVHTSGLSYPSAEGPPIIMDGDKAEGAIRLEELDIDPVY